MVKEKETEEKQEKKEKYIVEEIPTQTAPVIKDTETGDQYTLETALAKVLNNQERILKGLE